MQLLDGVCAFILDRLPNAGQKTRPSNNLKKKENLQIRRWANPANYRVIIKESKTTDKYLDHARELKKAMDYKGDGETSSNWYAQNGPWKIASGSKRVVNGRTSQDHPNYTIIEKNPGNLGRLAVTQDPVKNNQLSLIWKTFKVIIIRRIGRNGIRQYWRQWQSTTTKKECLWTLQSLQTTV